MKNSSAAAWSCRALLLGLLTLVLFAASMTSTSVVDGAESQRVLIRHTDLQEADSYWSPDLNQPADYVSPANYRDGRIYIRLDVTAKPSDIVMWPQLCMWRHAAKRYQYETCSPNLMDLSEPGLYYLDGGTLGEWWQRNDVFDWTKPVSVGRIMMKDRATRSLFVSSSCGTACYSGPEGVDPHVPVGWSADVILVAAGEQLDPPSKWHATCPAKWSDVCRGDRVTPRGTRPEDDVTPTDPGVATIQLSTSATSTTISVSWAEVTNARNYQVRYRQVGTSRHRWSSPSKMTSQVLTGLEPGTRYEVEVRELLGTKWQPFTTAIVKTVGGTDPSPDPDGPATPTPPPATPTPPPATPTPTPATPTPTPPPEPTATPVATAKTIRPTTTSTATTITASWLPVRSARSYQVRYRVGSGRDKWLAPDAATSRTIEALTPGTTYTIEIRDYRGGEWQPWTTTSATTTTAGNPPATPPPVTPSPATTPSATPPAGDGTSDHDAPVFTTSVSLTPRAGELVARWTPVPKGINYQLRYRVVGSRPKWHVPENDLSETITGLTPGTDYLVEVRAYVRGAWRDWVSAVARPR